MGGGAKRLPVSQCRGSSPQWRARRDPEFRLRSPFDLAALHFRTNVGMASIAGVLCANSLGVADHGPEARFAIEKGVEALEQRFEAAGLDCLDPARNSVV